MKKRKKSIFNIKKYALIFLVTLIIILIFTFIDYIVHSLKEEYSVPSDYFRNKIIFGTLIGFIAMLFRNNVYAKSLVFSVAVSALLQIRYYLEGYPYEFVFEFLIFHFLMLLPVSFIVLKVFEKKIKQY